MNETKHTPGPWVFADHGGHDLWGGPDGSIKVMNTEWGSAIRNHMDARLIAAAPDLLAALRQMVVNSETDGNSYRDSHRSALEAIAKAEGQP